MKESPFCSIVIVTHNCERYVRKAMESVNAQTKQPGQIIIVDSGSSTSAYLEAYADQPNVVLVLDTDDIGFCKANNIAMTRLPQKTDYVFFLNPDAMIVPTFLEEAIAYMERPENHQVGALTGKVLGYDIEAGKPSGRYDSTGIFHKWYGKWYDRGQGEYIEQELYNQEETVPAICGAVFFCRKKALDTILLRGKEVFDNTFFMYKDDIDLSLRLRAQKWSIRYVPTLLAYHCRGWNRDRRKMPKRLRLYSAWNELRIHARLRSPLRVAYSLCKYAAVKFLNK
jgi:GT2 family glycosyltransferase